MSYILVCRNWSSKALFAVTCEDGEAVAEYESHEDARAAAKTFPWHDAWEWDVVEIDI